MILNIHFECDSEILNHEYERELGHASEDEFTSDDVVESNNDDESDKGLVLMLRDGKTNAPDSEEEDWTIKSFAMLIKQQRQESKVV